jgi:hypothetical protein
LFLIWIFSAPSRGGRTPVIPIPARRQPAALIKRLVVALSASAALIAPPARGDSWAAARTREVFSESREYFVRILPGESLGDTFGFAGAKKGRYARAEFYRRAADRSYQLVAEASLLNPVAPVEVLVADNGHLVTLDNWHNVGHGRVVAIYDARGKLVRAYELRELFAADEIKRFPHSVSSIHWRKGPAYVRQDQRTALVTVAAGADFLFGVESGEFKYCESHEKTYRCRNAAEPRQWRPNASLPLER